MDIHSKRLYLLITGGVIIVLFHTAVLGEEHFSFGRVINQSFGPDYIKSWVCTEIFVPVHGTVSNIDLALDMEHTSFCDLKIYIDSPQGTSACINYYDSVENKFVPGRNINGWMVLDEESPFDIDSASQLNMGFFKPNGPDRLSDFYGQQSYGTWQVRIRDAIFADTGVVRDVRLDFTIDPEPLTPLFVPEPTTLLLAVSGAAFLLRIKRNT
jgi:subtilisin-like proprotein convertase family protein